MLRKAPDPAAVFVLLTLLSRKAWYPAAVFLVPAVAPNKA
jgi:hypothetical protein